MLIEIKSEQQKSNKRGSAKTYKKEGDLAGKMCGCRLERVKRRRGTSDLKRKESLFFN